MKRILKTKWSNVKSLHEVDGTKHYGVIFEAFYDPRKYLLLGTDCDTIVFRDLVWYTTYHKQLVRETIEQLVNEGNGVFEFETAAELLAWLSSK